MSGPAPVTADQWMIIWNTEHVCGSISIFACLVALGSIAFIKRLQTPFNHIMSCVLINDLLVSVVKSISYQPFNYAGGNLTPACQFLGYVASFSPTSSSAWNFVMALHCMRATTSKTKFVPTNWTFFFYHLYGWGMGFASCAAAAITQAIRNNGVVIMGNAGLICWISGPYQAFRIYLVYLVIWTHYLLLIGMYFYIYLQVRELSRSQIHQSMNTSSAQSGTKKVAAPESNLEKTNRRLLIKSMLVSIVFVVVWLPGTASRLYGVINPTLPTPFWLLEFHSVTVPSHGLINSIIFGYYSYSKIKREEQAAGSSQKGIVASSNSKISAAPT